jgi:OOP family OmpA-OmpF porin
MQADVRSVRGFLSSSDEFGTSVSNNKYASIGLSYVLSLPPPPPLPQPEPAPAVQPAEPPPPPPAPPPPRFVKVTLSATELFPFDSAQLGPSQPELDQIAAALKADASITDVTITGYADRIGSERYNKALSERRAQAVRDYLVEQGVASERLSAIGKGEDNPVVTCEKMPLAELKECLRPNRRVEVEDITIERRVQ